MAPDVPGRGEGETHKEVQPLQEWQGRSRPDDRRIPTGVRRHPLGERPRDQSNGLAGGRTGCQNAGIRLRRFELPRSSTQALG